MNSTIPSAGKPMKLLVVNDSLPDQTTGAGQRLVHILRALHELGHAVTFISRDEKNQQALAPALIAFGIKVYSGDSERLPALGKDVSNTLWSLSSILVEKQFDIAILTQNFRCGISVPEHYLDAIRAHSPRTKIIVLNEALYGKSAHCRAEITQQLEHREVAEDWSVREADVFHRADLAVIRHSGDEAWILQNHPRIQTAVVSPVFSSGENRAWKDRKGVLLPLDLTQSGDIDAFTWFLERFWPLIHRGRGDLELLVAGAEQLPLDTRQKLDRVRWLNANDTEQISSARLFIAPWRFGKISDSLTRMIAKGLPGIVTTYAADYAGFKAGYGTLVANTPQEFSNLVLQLYANADNWEEISARGVQFANEHYSWEGLKRGLQDTLSHMDRIDARPASNTALSMTRVDSLYGEVICKAPQDRRGALRLDAHVQLAQELLRTGKPTEALAQLRHVFSWLGESLQYSAPLARLLAILARCYRELGDGATVAACALQARRCFVSQTPQNSHVAPAIKKGVPKISLIVPTYNRLPILKKCMAALETQTFQARDFEVIVIDDGSSDGTEEMMRQYHPPFQLQYLRQTNSGTGAARRNGLAHANGEYLLLMNDDTICDSNLIEQHMRVQRELASERWAVLGNFEYPVEAHRRAFTHFLRTGSFMFPQIDMEAGFPYPYSHFITCNLSIRRQAVVEAGSFDSTYKLSEDTELGIRLFEMGYGVLYHPAAHAWHDHLPYAVGNLIRRARVYGADYFYMFRRHPRVVKEWAMPVNLAGMDHNAARGIQQYLEANRSNVQTMAAALDQWENVEFEPLLARPQDAAKVMALFQQAVPAIHWFYLLEKMLETMTRELNLSLPVVPAFAAGATHGSR